MQSFFPQSEFCPEAVVEAACQPPIFNGLPWQYLKCFTKGGWHSPPLQQNGALESRFSINSPFF